MYNVEFKYDNDDFGSVFHYDDARSWCIMDKIKAICTFHINQKRDFRKLHIDIQYVADTAF